VKICVICGENAAGKNEAAVSDHGGLGRDGAQRRGYRILWFESLAVAKFTCRGGHPLQPDSFMICANLNCRVAGNSTDRVETMASIFSSHIL
jgi:hypothetical protein